MPSLTTRLARTLSIGGAAGALALGGGLALSASADAADAAIPGTPCTVTATIGQAGVDAGGSVTCTGASQPATMTMCMQRDDGGAWVDVGCYGASGTVGGGGGVGTTVGPFQPATGVAYRVYTIATVAGQQGSVVSDTVESVG